MHLGVLCVDVHRSGDEESVTAAGDGVVEAAFLVQVGANDLQAAKCLQLLEVGVLLHVIWDSESSEQRQINTLSFRDRKPKRVRMNGTWVPDGRLHGVALLQQHLYERRGDVPVPSGDARHLTLLTPRHGRPRADQQQQSLPDERIRSRTGCCDTTSLFLDLRRP
jgi:hypothetical protein